MGWVAGEGRRGGRRVFGVLVVALALGVVIVFLARSPSAPGRAPTVVADRPEVAEPAPVGDSAPAKDARGQALDEDGQCVPGARITLYRVPWDEPPTLAIASVVTDGTGRLPTALPHDNDGVLVIDAGGYPLQAHRYYGRDEIRIERGTDRTMVITDEAEQPLGNTLVELFADRWCSVRLASATSDPRGVVKLRIAGIGWLLVRHPGRACVRLDIYYSCPPPASLALPPEFTVGGRIVDSDGRPLPGVFVRLRQEAAHGLPDYDMNLVTGEEGDFLFRGVHDGTGEIEARLKGYVARYRTTVRPGDEHVRIVMRRTASLSGVVVMPDGSPASLALVQMRYGSAAKTHTDAEGRFRLEEISPRPNEIRAILKDIEAALDVEPKEGEEVMGLRLVLGSPRSYVRVRVVDEEGRPVPDARLYARAFLHTQPTGDATLDWPESPGTEVKIDVVRTPGYCGDEKVSAVTSATPDEAPVKEIVLYAPVLVRLDAHAPDGTPVPNAWMAFGIDRNDEGRLRLSGESDDRAGGWWLNPVQLYEAEVDAPRHLRQTVKGWRPRDHGNVLSVTLEPDAGLRGRVVVDRGTTPDVIRVASDSGWAKWLQCEPDGSFQMDKVPPGRAILTIGRQGNAPEARVEIHAKAGEVADLGTIPLVPGALVTGRVVAFDGDPVGGARVELRTRLPEESEGTYTRADGTFRMVAPAFSDGTLIVRKQGLGAARAAVPVGPPRAIGDLVMPSPESVQVDVVAKDTSHVCVAVAWADASAVLLDYDWLGPSDEGRYRSEELAPGRYVAKLWAGDDFFRQEFAVVAGQTTQVTFRLDR